MEAVAGFDDAYVDLFTRARRVAERILTDRAEAEDVAGETMIRALVHWGRVGSYAPRWVTRVATNLALDRARRRPARPEPRRAAALDDQVSDRLDVAGALQALPRRQAQAVALRYLVGLEEAEIAAVLGVRSGTVKTHLRRGLHHLRSGPWTLEEVR